MIGLLIEPCPNVLKQLQKYSRYSDLDDGFHLLYYLVLQPDVIQPCGKMFSIKISPEGTSLEIGIDKYLNQPTGGIHHLNHGMATS